MTHKTVLAVDLGAESGRVMAVHFNGMSLQLEELQRFPNGAVDLHGTLYWDFLRLWSEIETGIAKGLVYNPAGIGVDTWGVDFGLLDRKGDLLSNPVCYRDGRTEEMMESAFSKVPKTEIFERTGIQFMRINTLYQLLSLVESESPLLDVAETFLMTPDLINYWLTDVKANEFTVATTSQMVDAQSGDWDRELLQKLSIPTNLFPKIAAPGTILGAYQNTPVIAPATHDTGSAVASVPVIENNWAFISSGTWSLIGLEIGKPNVSKAALDGNLTNEGGVDGTYRLLQNLSGLWIVQQCRATWKREGRSFSYGQLVDMARESGLREPQKVSLIDVNDPVFLPPGDHPQFVRDYCQQTGQSVPQTDGDIIRVVLESLALAYRHSLETLTAVSGQPVDVIHIVGGGIQNELLNQMTANATNRPVITGPIEATVIGNALVQLIAIGELNNIAEGRKLVAGMENWQRYEPQDFAAWEGAYHKYLQLFDRGD